MKNIQVVDDAINCTLDIFEIGDAEFLELFPDGTDIEFETDLFVRLGEPRTKALFEALWTRRVDKQAARGIHGTLFFGAALCNAKRPFYPSKKDAEMIANPPSGTSSYERTENTNYSASLFFESDAASSSEDALWEESIILVEASCESEAREKAEALGRSRGISYEAEGKTVTWTFRCVERVCPLDDQLSHGIELFNRFLKNSEVESILSPIEQALPLEAPGGE